MSPVSNTHCKCNLRLFKSICKTRSMLSVVTLVESRSQCVIQVILYLPETFKPVVYVFFAHCVRFLHLDQRWMRFKCIFFPILFLNLMFIRFSISEWSEFTAMHGLDFSHQTVYRRFLVLLATGHLSTHWLLLAYEQERIFNSHCLHAIHPLTELCRCKRKLLNAKCSFPNLS